MKKWTLSAATLLLAAGITTNASAQMFDINGIFNMIAGGAAPGKIMVNEDAATNAWYGLHTAFTGSYDSATGVFLMNSFAFGGSIVSVTPGSMVMTPRVVDPATGIGTFDLSMKFNWGAAYNYPVTAMVDNNPVTKSAWQVGGATPVNVPKGYTLDDKNQTKWQWSMMDGDGDGISGNAMLTPPYPGYSVNFDFNMTPQVPEPASMLLLGSGLAGLLGLARRRQ